MFENIEANRSNFCVGPQSGTYCTVDDEVTPVVMHVKNDSGGIVRTYTFYPQDTLDTGPKDVNNYELLPNPTTYTYHEFITIQYVGPYDQASYFDGAIFYTLEKRALGRRMYYTYTDPSDPDYTRTRVEYNSNIIRKWVLDDTNFRLVLDRTFFIDSDEINWFDGNAFAIDHVLTDFADHTTTNTGVIEITTTSGLKKYDTLFLGPSSDTDNPGMVEEVYVHSVNGTTVEIKTYGGEDPPIWEYVEGDPITTYKDIFLFSNTRPLINPEEIAYGQESGFGTLYRLDSNNYLSVLEKDYNGIYQDVLCATWNNYYGMLSFVKGTNLLHLTTTDFEISRSQDIHLENPNTVEPIPIFDIDIKDFSVYKLQLSILQHDDTGQYYEETWTKYNYHADTFVPYTNSTSLYVSERVLIKQGQSFVTVIVRDQFGVGLLGKNVWFTMEGDISGEFTPADGYLNSDANGKAVIQYDAGSGYTGHHEITVKVDGSNSVHGSTFIVASTLLQQYHEFISPCLLRTVILLPFNVKLAAIPNKIQQISIPTRVAYAFPGNMLNTNDINGWVGQVNDPTKIIFQQKIPTFRDVDAATDDVFTKIRGTKLLLNDPKKNEEATQDVKITSQEIVSVYKKISANFISRHLSYGHLDNVVLNQFVFVQDARPAMWSKKNNVNTDFWIRLRPFAASLNPTTLIIKMREESYIGDHGWVDVTDLGVITMFDAGGGLLGIDFFYDPEGLFHHNSIIYIDIEVYDTAAIPNIVILTYWFKIIQDYKAPYVINRIPVIEAYNVAINTPISFDLIDEGEGVDITTLEVFVNQRTVSFTYDEYEPGNYHIYCIINNRFHFGQTVSINLTVYDRSDNDNILIDGWKFYCMESEGPWFDMDNTIPDLCLEGLQRKQSVSMQVYGIDDTGIKYDSIKMEVGGRYRNLKLTPIVYRLN